MMDSQTDFMMTLPPTASRPLAGLTLLLVEDSRFASEAMRLMTQRSGARLRRADTLASARMHLRVYRPAVVIIDLGLPDGYGEGLITDLSRAHPRVDVILGMSGDPDGEMRSVVAGADGFLPKPMGSLAAFQSLILKHLPTDRQLHGLRVVTNDNVVPDLVAYEDDLAQAAEVLAHCHDGRSLDYVTQFLSGIARSADDRPLTHAVAALDQCRHDGQPILPSLSRVMALVQARLSAPSGPRLQ